MFGGCGEIAEVVTERIVLASSRLTCRVHLHTPGHQTEIEYKIVILKVKGYIECLQLLPAHM